MPVTIDKFEYPSDVLAQAAWTSMFGIDEYVKVLLHFNGSNESQVFTDSSPSPHTFSAVGNAQISTAQSKFGGSSYLGDGNGDYITCPYDAQIIRDILTHLGLWLIRSRPPPKICAAITLFESKASDSYAHPPHQHADAYADPQYSWDDYIQS